MVQKGKFSAGADALVSTLKKVDFLHTAFESSLLDTPEHYYISTARLISTELLTHVYGE